MKKLLFTLVVLTITNVSFANIDFVYNYPKANELISKMPGNKDSYIALNKQIITDGKLDISVSLKLSWRNMSCIDVFFGEGYWTVVGIRYERKVYYASVNSTNYNEIVDLRVNDGYIDLKDISMRPSDSDIFNLKECSYLFKESMTADVSKLSPNIDYNLKVEYTFTVVPIADDGESDSDNRMALKYVQPQIVPVENASTGVVQKFKILSTASNSVINVVGDFNPLYNTGSGDRYLVYNHPDAVISVVADTVNLPDKKIMINGTSISYQYGAGAYLASIGSSSFPTKVAPTVTEWSGCGFLDNQCSKKCSNIDEPTFEFLNDNSVQQSFLKRKGYSVQEKCYWRRTNIMQRSIDTGMTTYDENTVENFALSKSTDYRMNRTFHLRDLSNVDKYSKKGYGTGSVIKIQNSAIYNTSFTIDNYSKYENFYALGYSFYGPTYDSDIATGKGVVSNILEFEVVSAATLTSLSESEKLPKMTCITDSLFKEGDYIHLKGYSIKAGNYSETLYNPEYMWEVSFNGTDWEPLDKVTFSKYIIDRNGLHFAVVIDPDKDILLKSTILRNRTQAQFRQKVILRSFASDEYSSLYNYKIDDKYYISIVSKDYYTYIPTPILDEENIAFSPSTFPLEQRLCKGDVLVNKKISFKLRNSTNVSSDKINMLAEISDYKIYELKDGAVGKLVSNANSYTMNYSGETIGYRCVISWCTDSIYKDVYVIANDDEVIDLNDIYANVVIAEKNQTENKVKLLCQRGNVPTISLYEKGDKEFNYSYRGVATYVEPTLTTTDFSTMSRTKLTSFMKSAGWDYEAETGTSVDNTGIEALRAWCRVKEDKQNNQIIATATEKFRNANAWCNFTDQNSTVLPISNADASSLDFYIMKQNNKTKCFSDSVKLELVFFDGIEDNKIAFSAAASASKSEIYVMENTGSPSIKGFVIKGGYGVPSSENNYKYVYRYIYREKNSVWQQLSPDVEVSGEDSKSVSLKAGALTMDRMYQIARIVYSRVGNDFLTQVSDTSNILTINIIEELKADDVDIYNNGGCAGAVIGLCVTKYDPDEQIKNATRFVWTASDTAVTVIPSGEMDKYCSLYNTKSNFNVSVYRQDTISNAKTKTIVIPIEVVNVHPHFSITADGVTRNILEYPDEKFYFQSGTRFVLNNNSAQADSYLWNLELQYYTGNEVEGLVSYLESPVCYLYNPGQNKIRLTAKNELGCESQITADNIYIQSSSMKNANMNSYFEEERVPQLYNGSAADFEVYPTITNGEDIKILYSKGVFKYTLINHLGQVMQENFAENNHTISYNELPDGVSNLLLDAEDNGNQIHRIVRLIK